MESKALNIILKIWRQESKTSKGRFEEFKVSVSPDASILEMLDELNIVSLKEKSCSF
jgi:succinate dehydrogenase/fumarate reductase-like Fe-S protein